jgi:hypothetical protein
MQVAAIHMSFIGRGRPRSCAAAASRPQVRETSGLCGTYPTPDSQRSMRARLDGPQWRTSTHFVSSASVTNVTHGYMPASRVTSGAGRRLRKLCDDTSVSRTT